MNALSLNKYIKDFLTENFELFSFSNLFLSIVLLLFFTGLIVAPKSAHGKHNPASKICAPFQPILSSKYLIKGARIKAPAPEPQVAIPVVIIQQSGNRRKMSTNQ
jgi:hypothetical protein